MVFQPGIDLGLDVVLDLASYCSIGQSRDVDRDVGVDPFRKRHQAQLVVDDIRLDLELDADAEVSEIDIGKILGIELDRAAGLEMEDRFQYDRVLVDQIQGQ